LLLQLASPDVVRENISISSNPVSMRETPSTAEARTNTSAGHLSVHVEGQHPVEVEFNFDQGPKRLGISFGVSAILDVSLVSLLTYISSFPARPYAVSALLPETPNQKIIWLAEPGPGGGGGGGGNRMKEPPRKAEMPGKDKITVPVDKAPPKLEPQVAKHEPT